MKLKSIVISTAGNMMGRAFNILLPVVIVYELGFTRESDLILFYLAASQYASVSVANAYTDALIAFIGKGRGLSNLLHEYSFLFFLSLASVLFIVIGRNAELDNVGLLLVLILSFVGLLSARYSAYLLSDQRYAAPGLAWVTRSIPILWLLFSEYEPTLVSLLCLVVIADLVRLGLMYFLSRRHVNLNRPTKDVSIGALAAIMLGPMIFGVNPIIDRMIAGLCEQGAISIFEMAERAYGVIAVAISIGLATVSLVEFSHVVKGQETRRLLTKNIQIALLFGVLGTILGLLGMLVVSELSLFGSDRQPEFEKMLSCLFVLLLTLPIFMVGLVSVRLLIAEQRQTLIVAYSVIGVITNVVLSYILATAYGVIGVAVGTLGMCVVNSALATYSAYKLTTFER